MQVTVVLLFLATLASTQDVKRKKPIYNSGKSLQIITSGNNKFSLSLYKTLVENLDNNLVVSPISLDTALALMYLGAGGRTAQQLEEGLHLPKDHMAARLGFWHLMSSMKSTNMIDLEMANRLYLQSSYSILKDFRRAARKAFRTDVKEVNFENNTEKATRMINAWVEKRTHKKISNLIEPGVLTQNTKMVLVNAVYMKASWLTPFNTMDTKDEPFYTKAAEAVTVPMMNIKSYFPYYKSSDLGFQILELPYEGELVSMIVLLPDSADGIDDLEDKISTFNLSHLLKQVQADEVQVKLPKFKIQTSVQLKENLKQLGMKDMFNAETANFTGITGERELHITHILQKAFIEVTELGTEAGASTAVVIEPRMWKPPPPEFKADHPFIFIIWHKVIETTLFMGRVMNPHE